MEILENFEEMEILKNLEQIGISVETLCYVLYEIYWSFWCDC